MAEDSGRARGRPIVSVVVPFAGSDEQFREVLDRTSRLELRDGDEAIVADNRPGATPSKHGAVRIVAASGTHTPGFARNCGAGQARGEWLVFLDADTAPSRSLLDDYFDPPPSESTAILAGAILDAAPGRSGIAARHAVARTHMSQETTMRRGRPYAQSANCAVRRSAFEQVGGFAEEARAGEDADLCFRLQAKSWRVEDRPRAVVEHHPRETVPALLRQLAQHGSGAAWVNRRFPGSFPAASPGRLARRLVHSCRGAAAALRAGDRETAALELLDLLGALAYELGRLMPNRRAARACRSGPPGSHG